MMIKNLAEHIPREKKDINSMCEWQESDQTVHLQCTYMANCYVSRFISLYRKKVMYGKFPLWSMLYRTSNMAIHVMCLLVAVSHVQVLYMTLFWSRKFCYI